MFVLHSVTPGTPDNTYNIRVDKVRDEDQRKDWNKEYTRKKSLRGFARKQDMLGRCGPVPGTSNNLELVVQKIPQKSLDPDPIA